MTTETKKYLKIGIGAFLLYLCIYYWDTVVQLFATALGAATPLIIGCVIAYIVNILMNFYERHYFPKAQKPVLCKSRRSVCLVAAIITLIAVVALVVVLIVPQLVACIQLLVAEVPGTFKSIVVWLEQLDVLPEDIMNFLSTIDWQSRISQIVGALTSGIGNVLDTVVSVASSVFSGIVTAFLSVIFAIYLLLGKDKLSIQCIRLMQRYMKSNRYQKMMHICTVANDCFHKYIVGQCTEAVILGLLCFVGMLILRLPYAAMISALIAFTALIPVAGAYIGGGVGAFMIFTVSPVKAVVFLVFLVILQQLEGNIIYPRVVGTSMGLPAIWVLAAVTIGGGVMGVLGMLIGVPIAATLYRLLREDVYKTDQPKT